MYPSHTEDRVERMRSLAILAGLGGVELSGVSTDEARSFAEQAVAALADLIKSTWSGLGELKESDFDTLRDRADFKELVAELDTKATRPAEAAPDDTGEAVILIGHISQVAWGK